MPINEPLGLGITAYKCGSDSICHVLFFLVWVESQTDYTEVRRRENCGLQDQVISSGYHSFLRAGNALERIFTLTNYLNNTARFLATGYDALPFSTTQRWALVRQCDMTMVVNASDGRRA